MNHPLTLVFFFLFVLSRAFVDSLFLFLFLFLVSLAPFYSRFLISLLFNPHFLVVLLRERERERERKKRLPKLFLWRLGSAFCTASNCTKSPSDVPSSDVDGIAAGAVVAERDGRNHGQQCEANRLLIHLPVSAKISHSLSPFFMAGDDVIHESVEFEIFDTARTLSRGRVSSQIAREENQKQNRITTH